MTFTKPTNITYTEMAQWVDKNAYLPNCDEYKLYQYLYHIVFIKAQTKGYFNNKTDLDDFSVYCSSRLVSRLRSLKVESSPIKNITNYVNSIVPLWRADYVRDYCAGDPDIEIEGFNVVDFGDYLIDITQQNNSSSFIFGCLNITDIFWKHIQRIPRKKHSCELVNIYASCLLTLQDRIDYAVKYIDSHKSRTEPELLSCLSRELKLRSPILYHIDDCYRNYISTLVVELTHALSVELSYSTNSSVSVSTCLQNLVIAANNAEEEDNVNQTRT